MSQQPVKTSILIVDDSEAVRRLLHAYLRMEGYEVIEASNGRMGLTTVAEKRPDLILLDISMPIMDGYSVCAHLQHDENFRSIPIIMLSSLSDTESKMRAFELGAVDYITKPVSRGELAARIQTHLTISRLTTSLQQANQELLANQKQLLESLHAAADLQKNLLPKSIPDCKKLHFASFFKPCQEVGGDIYNIQRLDSEHLALYVIDVSGHGFSAAMMTALASQALSKSGTIVTSVSADGERTVSSPRSVIQALDEEFPLSRFNLYMTIIYLLVNTTEESFRYCCAGHPPAVHVLADGSLNTLNAGGPPAGMGGVWEEGEGLLNNGDRIYFYTDGISEYHNENGEYYSDERLLQSMRDVRNLPLQAAVQNIIGEVKKFGNQTPSDDDMTFLALERKQDSDIVNCI
jgi:sigma-B regulation protein RsbU (phosphoserine phosphatase)